MDDRQVRLLVVLAAVVAMVGLIYVLAPRTSPEAPWDAAASHSVWSFSSEQVVLFTLQVRGESELVVRREGSGWIMVEPDERPADTRRVERALSTLADLELAVPLPDADPGELGLDEPHGRVRIGLASGQELTLDIGDEAPVGWQTYARTADGTLVALPGHLSQDVLLEPSAFRESSVLRYALDQVRAAELHSPGGTLRVSRDSGGDWWLEGWGRADPRGLDNLFVSLLDLRVDAFVDHLAPDGIDDPRHRVVVELAGGERLEARFGDQLPMGRLTQTASGGVGVVRPELLALLDQGPTDLLDQHAFPVRSDRIERIVIAIDEGAATLHHDQGRWRASGLDTTQANQLLEALDQAAMDLPPTDPFDQIGAITGRVRIHYGDDRARLIELGTLDGGERRIRDASGGPITTVPEPHIQKVIERLPDK